MAWSLLTCVVHATEVWRRELDGGPLLDDPRAHGQRRINCIRSSRAVSLSLTTALLPGVMGCSEKSGVEEQTKVSGPEGTTTIKVSCIATGPCISGWLHKPLGA